MIEIKRAALAVKRPKMAWGDKSAGYVECAFDAEAEKEPDEDDMDEEGKKKPKAATGDTAAIFAQFMQLAKDGAATTATADAAPTPYQQHKQKLSGAHKQPQKGA